MTNDEEHAMSELQTLLNRRIEGVARSELSTNTIDTIFDEVLHQEHGG